MRLRISSQPMIGHTVGKKWVSGLIMNSRPASAVTHAGGHRELPRPAPKRSRHRFDQPGRDQQSADHVRGDGLAGREQRGAGAEEDDDDPRDAERARADQVGQSGTGLCRHFNSRCHAPRTPRTA